jgi:hypothetical protein
MACVEDSDENMIRYFDEVEFKDLLNFDINNIGCDTLKFINEKHRLNLPDTPTINSHKEYLENLP